MKIAISEIESQEILCELNHKTAEEIVGGKTQVSIATLAYAEGDVANTRAKSKVLSFSHTNPRGRTHSFSVGIGIAFARSVEYS